LDGDAIYYFAVVAHKGIAVSNYSSQASAMATEPVLFDDFTDGTRGAMWRSVAQEPDPVRLMEINGRLELLATWDSGGQEAAHAANEWQIDAGSDFDVDIGFHHESTAGDSGLFVRLDPNAEGETHLTFQAGNSGATQTLSYRQAVDGSTTASDEANRTANDGVLRIVYDSSLDTLSMFEGTNLLWEFPGLIGGAWGGQPVNIRIGGSCDGAALNSGQAYLDDFELNEGVLVNWPPATDINQDGFVDMEDAEVMSDYWLDEGPGLDADVNGDQLVNLVDFAEVARAWQ
jgi:hypothetical protein